MVSVWKRATVRVFLCSDNLDATENARRKSRLDDLLNQLRINALTHIVPTENVRNLLNRPVINESDLVHYQQPATHIDILNASEIYLKAANQLIKQYSENSSLCFLYLPPPPKLQLNNSFNLNTTELSPSTSASEQTAALIPTSQDTFNEHSQRYIKVLELLSDSLGPCIFVNGVSCVTSTHL